jgi:hypothetical protein
MLTEIGIEEREGVPILDPMLKHDLLKELEPEILERIKRGFDLYKGSVTIAQFIVIMVDVLFQQTNWKKYPKEILTFVELFLLIDLNKYALAHAASRRSASRSSQTTSLTARRAKLPERSASFCQPES